MNNRYLFKAKRISDGEWIVGYLYRLSENNPPFIMLRKYGESYEVDEHTICQCTGLKDKNGKLIWENDIANCLTEDCCGYIGWNESEAGFYFNVLLEDGRFEEEHIYDYQDGIEVIGNIFDNPELLESEEN
jgi:uncharacterized phage protein (TIGR01671 family)